MADYDSGRAILAKLKLDEQNPLRDFGGELHKLAELLDHEGHIAWCEHSLDAFADYRVKRAIADYEEAAPEIETRCRKEWAVFVQPPNEMERLFNMSNRLRPPCGYLATPYELIDATNRLLDQITAISKVWRKLAERLDGHVFRHYCLGDHPNVDRSLTCYVWVEENCLHATIDGRPRELSAPEHKVLRLMHEYRERKETLTLKTMKNVCGSGALTTLRRLQKKFGAKLYEHGGAYGSGYHLY